MRIYVLIVLLTVSLNSYAYIDPGTGSAIITALISFLLGIIAFFKRIINFIKKIFKFKK